MRTVYSEDHRLQDGAHELLEGQFMKAHESPSRAEIVIDRVRATKLGEVLEPQDFGLDPILKVHDKGLVEFLRNAWAEWAATGRTFDALPHVWPVPGLGRRLSDSIDGKLGYYAIDAGTPITPGTWRAILSSANVALTAQKLVATGEKSVFALCRPPGHHAEAGMLVDQRDDINHDHANRCAKNVGILPMGRREVDVRRIGKCAGGHECYKQ